MSAKILLRQNDSEKEEVTHIAIKALQAIQILKRVYGYLENYPNTICSISNMENDL